MSTDNDSSKSNSDIIVFTDLEEHPITVDKNPAHFEGFLHEIAEYCKRTGHFISLVEQRAVATASTGKTIVDNVSAVPFVHGAITGAKSYNFFDPCPPLAGVE